MKTDLKTVAAAVAIATLCGCASHQASGNAPGSMTGEAAQYDSAFDKAVGERFRTDTLMPGIGSALFPDPGWR